MAQLLVGWSPIPLAGRLVLDVGAGTGLAGRAAQAAGGHVLAVDLAADRPTTGFREARRVTEPGGTVLASSYGTEIRHPVRDAVDSALAVAGYRPPAWYGALKTGPMAALSRQRA